jgi:nifR3 family TIM-barrel protein
MNPLKIGKIKIKSPFLLAPMLEVTDLPYRIICRKSGCGLAYTEMIYADAITHKNPKTQIMLKTNSLDKPKAVQITANSTLELKKALPYLKKFDIIDLNCGCPSIKIQGTKAGAYLLNEPDKIVEFIKILKKSGKVVTAKIRLGFHSNNVLKIAKLIEQAGANAITVHARLATHSYSIPAQWNQIKLIKETLKIPVIGNGDVNSPEQAIRMLKETGCDAIMIARAAIGNPLIFKQCLELQKTGKYKQFSFKDNIKQFQEYLKLSEKYKTGSISKIKFIGTNFLRGVEGASKLRNNLMQLKSLDEIKRFTNEI